MEIVVFNQVTKIFRHRPALFNWLGRERSGETRALDSVSLTASTGEVLALLGPNGSGKTTLLKLISTMLLPDAGTISVAGSDVVRDPERARRRVGFAVASERSFFPRLTARENLDFFGTLDDLPRTLRRERMEDALETTGLNDAADTLVMKFSSGMYQRLGIARALLKQPPLLLLDEPTRSLDPGAARRLWDCLRRRAASGCTVILATHHFDEALAVADQIAILRRGTLMGPRPQAHTSADSLRDFYFRELEPTAELRAAAPWGAA